jgi:hypothetical protein
MNNDGAFYALAGYLYQILGEWGLLAKAYLATPPSADGLSTLLAFTKTANAFHEPGGQDLGLEGLGDSGKYERKFIQFKYSTQTITNPITASEIMEIAEAFRASKEAANKITKMRTGYVLMSNRSLAAEASAIFEAAEKGKRHPVLGKPSEHKAERAVIKALSKAIYTIDQPQWEASLRRYSNQLGLTDSEFREGVKRLVYKLLKEASAASASPLSSSDLNFELAGFAAVPLSRDKVADNIRLQVKSLKTATRSPTDIFRRRVMDSIAASTDNALIILHGGGGAGKSVCLTSLLEDLTSPSAVPAQYVLAKVADELPINWFSQIVAKWRNCAEDKLSSDSPEVSLGRLSDAHASNSRPVVVLAIDGFDELEPACAERIDYVRKLITFTWQEYLAERNKSCPPKLVLLATCRDKDEVLRYLPREHQYSSSDPQPTPIEVPDFDLDELEVIARDRLTQPVSDRIAAHIAKVRSIKTVSLLTQAAPPHVSQTLQINEDVYAALSHPLFWGMFCDLTEAEQHRVLDGEEAVIWKLCVKYLHWFCERAKRKNLGCDVRRMKGILKSVAVVSRTLTAPFLQQANWIAPARGAGFGDATADWLFLEAKSFGLVKLDSAVDAHETWRWRHPFIGDFIATQDF